MICSNFTRPLLPRAIYPKWMIVGEIDTRSQQRTGIMCPCQAEINGKTSSVAVGWEEKCAESYPSSQLSNRNCGNLSCPIQRCGWIPLWPAWAPLLRDRSGQDKKDEKMLSISTPLPHKWQMQQYLVLLEEWKCGAYN